MKTTTKNLLLELQKLPKYQLERRIDIFVLEKLSAVFTSKFGTDTHFVYPEFPLQSLENIPKDAKIDNNLKQVVESLKVRNTNHNTNVDYLLATKDTFYLVEFKTDSKSFSHTEQLLYYAYYITKNNTFSELHDFFKCKLTEGNNQDPKWKDGYKYLNENYKKHFARNIVEDKTKKLKLIYLAPSHIIDLPEYGHFTNYLGKEKLEFVSLKEFAELIDNDTELKDLLIQMDEADNGKFAKSK